MNVMSRRCYAHNRIVPARRACDLCVASARAAIIARRSNDSVANEDHIDRLRRFIIQMASICPNSSLLARIDTLVRDYNGRLSEDDDGMDMDEIKDAVRPIVADAVIAYRVYKGPLPISAASIEEVVERISLRLQRMDRILESR